jgi:hypothetical protein
MEVITAFWESFKSFIIREFLWFFLSLFLAILLTMASLWLMNEFSFSLNERIQWQGIEKNSVFLFVAISWFITIYLIRLVRGAILYMILPKEEEPVEE